MDDWKISESAALAASLPVINKVTTTGEQSLSDAELVAYLFDISLLDARQLLSNYGSLRTLATNNPTGKAIAEFSRRLLAEKLRKGNVLEDPDAVRNYLIAQIRDRKAEVFCCIFLDNRHRVIAFEEMFYGTIDGASVYPREVVRRVLHHNAAAVVFAHNHPSGIAEPSQADERITQRLKEALSLIDVRVLDHFVIGDSIVSFAERGLL